MSQHIDKLDQLFGRIGKQGEQAKEIGILQSRLSSLLGGVVTPTADDIRKIAKWSGTTHERVWSALAARIRFRLGQARAKRKGSRSGKGA